MASIQRHRDGWRAQVRRGSQRDSRVFRTKAEAARWALQREAEMRGSRVPDHTLADALKIYMDEVAPTHRGARWEIIRLQRWLAQPWTQTRMRDVTADMLAEWRNARLREVSASSVCREMTLLRSVLEHVRRPPLRWIETNPFSDVKRPPAPPSRKRRISDDEIARIMAATGLDDGLRADTAMQRTGLAFLFALETAMRAGEILGMRWEDVGPKSVTLPRTKNGDSRRVPLSPRAREILAVLPRGRPTCFDLHPGTRDALWRRAAAGIHDLHFHDSRAEAIWRLSKKLDVLELARVIGHRDIRSLMIYYQADADELADRL
jgi:integrase